MENNRYGFVNQLVFHPVYWVQRDKSGMLLEISKTEFAGAVQESVLHTPYKSSIEVLAISSNALKLK
jgi:hypothetical protein